MVIVFAVKTASVISCENSSIFSLGPIAHSTQQSCSSMCRLLLLSEPSTSNFFFFFNWKPLETLLIQKEEL